MKTKKLKLLDVFCLASGAMISSGLFILPGVAHEVCGPAVVLAYLLAGGLALTGVFSQAELVSAMPRAGGTCFFVMRSMGPAVGTVNGIMTWLSLSLKTAFALVGMGTFTAMILPWARDNHTVIAVALTIFFAALNIQGAKKAGVTQNVLVIGLLIILSFFIVKGLPQVKIQNLAPFAPFGFGAVFSTAGMVFVSFGGLVKVASVAEDIYKPERNTALAMLLALGIITLVYVLVVFVASGVLGDALNGSLTPISDAAYRLMGNRGRTLLGGAALLAFVSTANAGIMASSRYPFALARDGLLPDVLTRVNKAGMPSVALGVTAVAIMIALFLPLTMLVKTASGVLILTFMFSCLCVIVMRESRVLNYQPKFKSPLYPWMQIVGVSGCMALVFSMGWQVVVSCLALTGLSLVFYWFYGRIRSTQEFALLHLVERLTSRDLTAHMLEDELKDIIRKRDEIESDRFDEVIESCHILDLEDDCDSSALFEKLAKILSDRDKRSKSAIHDLLLDREYQSSTVIAEGLAIPHIILEGTGRFEIVVARSRKGIAFPNDAGRAVQAVFCLAGTEDQRNFHLQVLAAIAQVALQPEFLGRWKAARNSSGLRDIILLSTRMRGRR